MIRVGFRTGAVSAFLVLILIVVASFLISKFLAPLPQLDVVDSQVTSPGQMLRLSGSFFGAERGVGVVTFSGQEPHTNAYQLWSKRRIEVVVPVSFSSGLVRVVTSTGASNGVLVTRSSDIPIPVDGEIVTRGPPIVRGITPTVASIGDQITIIGGGFGSSQVGSAVRFSIHPELTDSGFTVDSSVVDLDHVNWSDRRIVVRVPSGVRSGSVVVRTSTGISDPISLHVQNEVGSIRHIDPRGYVASYAVTVEGTDAASDANVYLWLPTIPETPAQRHEGVSAFSSHPVYQDQAGIQLFQIQAFGSSISQELRRHYRIRRYAIRTSIEPSNVRGYRTDTAFYSRFTDGDAVVPSGGRLRAIATRAIRGYVNPLWRARMIFQYVVARLRPVPGESARIAPVDAEPMEVVMTAIEERRAAPYEYAVSFSAIARAIGIPARPVAGYLISAAERALPHYWAEFYLQGFGWVPVDPAADDGAGGAVLLPSSSDADEVDRFFGNLDSHRIALAKGVADPQYIARARRFMHPQLAGLQTVHEDVVGELSGYRTDWKELSITGRF